MERVVLVRFSSLGDVVLTSALLEPLVKNGYRPLLVTYKPFENLFKEDPRLEVIAINRGDFFRNLKKVAEKINALKPFAVFDLHKNPKSRLLSFLIKAPLKVSYKKYSIKRRLCVFFNRFGFGDNLKRQPYNVLESYGETLKVLDIEPNRLRPKIEINPKSAEKTLKKHGLENGNYVVLGIGARYVKKRYPFFEKVANLLREKGFKVVLVGDKKDFELSKGWKGVVNLCGKLSLLESLHILSQASFYIGNDSGATHMARAVGTKVAVIYGSTHPCLGFAPYPDEGVVISKFLECSPCDIHGKGGCKYKFECLNIPPERVVSKALRLIKHF